MKELLFDRKRRTGWQCGNEPSGVCCSDKFNVQSFVLCILFLGVTLPPHLFKPTTTTNPSTSSPYQTSHSLSPPPLHERRDAEVQLSRWGRILCQQTIPAQWRSACTPTTTSRRCPNSAGLRFVESIRAIRSPRQKRLSSTPAHKWR